MKVNMRKKQNTSQAYTFYVALIYLMT